MQRSLEDLRHAAFLRYSFSNVTKPLTVLLQDLRIIPLRVVEGHHEQTELHRFSPSLKAFRDHRLLPWAAGLSLAAVSSSIMMITTP